MADHIKTLENILKLSKKQVEDTQKKIAEVLSSIEAFSLGIKKLNWTLEEEVEAAGTDPYFLSILDKFTQKTKKKIAEHTEKRKQLLQYEVQLREELGEEFATQKRYEILLERQQLALRKRLEKAQQAQLDEIAANGNRKE